VNDYGGSMTNKTLALVLACCLSVILLCCGNTYAAVEIKSFSPEVKRERPLEYAWASCNSLGKDCLVIIWIRGVHKDTRITITGVANNNLCHVEIPLNTFDKYFKYAVLAGLSTESNGPITAQFGGGPAGGRDSYWFEWSTNVKPSFYCILR